MLPASLNLSAFETPPKKISTKLQVDDRTENVDKRLNQSMRLDHEKPTSYSLIAAIEFW